jgi:hypothetical protein
LSIWLIINAINSLPDFDMKYPKSHAAEKELLMTLKISQNVGSITVRVALMAY